MILYFGGVLTGLAIGEEDGAVVGAFIGWVLGALWAIFALVQTILQVVNLIQLLAGG